MKATGDPPTCLIIGDASFAEIVATALGTSDRLNVCKVGRVGDLRLDQVEPGCVSAVVVAFHDDAMAVACAIEAAARWDPETLLVTIFDQTIGAQLKRTLPRSVVCSPGRIVAPYLSARLLTSSDIPIVSPGQIASTTADELDLEGGVRWAVPKAMRRRARYGLIAGQLRPHDGSTRLLYTGLAGLALVLLQDAVWLKTQNQTPWPQAVFEAARVVATVGPASNHGSTPAYSYFSSAAMLASLAFAAIFTVGLIERVVSERRIGLLGRRVLPRSGHIIVVGLGQVGYRLCVHLRELGMPVVGVDRDPESVGARMSRRIGIPVLIGDGSERRVLESLGLQRAVALAAVSSSDSQNLAVAIAAIGVDHGARVVGRLDEMQMSLEVAEVYSISAVVNVNSLAAAHVNRHLFKGEPQMLL